MHWFPFIVGVLAGLLAGGLAVYVFKGKAVTAVEDVATKVEGKLP